MFSLQSLLGREDKFFDLLEASSQEAKSSVGILVEILSTLETAPHDQQLENLVLSRRKDKRITQQITEELCRTFITPLEREDIESLSNTLYKIPKTIVKISERVLMVPLDPASRDVFKRQTALLEKAAEVVHEMTQQLRQTPKLETIREMNDRLQYFEGEADKVALDLLRSLYRGEKELRQAFALKDLCDLLERAVDRCRDAGNVILQIVMKNS